MNDVPSSDTIEAMKDQIKAMRIQIAEMERVAKLARLVKFRAYTADDNERLAELADLGWTASAIGDALGRTKNSVIGRCDRLGIRLRRLNGSTKLFGEVEPKPKISKRSKAHYGHIALQTVGLRVPERLNQSRGITVPKIKAARKPQHSIAVCPPEPELLRVPIVALEPGICHWPLGDPKTEGFSYCGVIASPDKPYCAHHEWLAHNEARGLA